MAFRDLHHANLTAVFGCQIGWFAGLTWSQRRWVFATYTQSMICDDLPFP